MTAIDDIGLEYASLAGTPIGAAPTRDRRTLPDEATLAEFRDRARESDENNTYFHEDLAVLREIGYLAATVPEEFGGWGVDLDDLRPACSERWLATRRRPPWR